MGKLGRQPALISPLRLSWTPLTVTSSTGLLLRMVTLKLTIAPGSATPDGSARCVILSDPGVSVTPIVLSVLSLRLWPSSSRAVALVSCCRSVPTSPLINWVKVQTVLAPGANVAGSRFGQRGPKSPKRLLVKLWIFTVSTVLVFFTRTVKLTSAPASGTLTGLLLSVTRMDEGTSIMSMAS